MLLSSLQPAQEICLLLEKGKDIRILLPQRGQDGRDQSRRGIFRHRCHHPLHPSVSHVREGTLPNPGLPQKHVTGQRCRATDRDNERRMVHSLPAVALLFFFDGNRITIAASPIGAVDTNQLVFEMFGTTPEKTDRRNAQRGDFTMSRSISGNPVPHDKL